MSLFIARIAPDVREDDLREAFGRYGLILVSDSTIKRFRYFLVQAAYAAQRFVAHLHSSLLRMIVMQRKQ